MAAENDPSPTAIMISKDRYEGLLKSEAKLTALEEAGVDNWEWYDEAMRSLNDEEGG